MTSTIHDIARQLDHEWNLLRTHHRAVGRVRSWTTTVDARFAPLLRSAVDLQDIVAATQSDCPDGNALLLVLVERSAHDQLAGQLVVRRLLPGVLSAVRRYGSLCEHADPASEAIGALWLAVRNYDVAQRPRHVAAALISDTMYLAFRRRTRQRSTGELPSEPKVFLDRRSETHDCAFIELAGVIAEARAAGVPPFDLDLLCELAAEPPGKVAQQRNVTTRTIRNHRNSAIERVCRAVSAV